MPGPAVGRKVGDAREARELLASWSTSGETMSAWCARRGINWYSLSAYKGWPIRKGDALVEVQVDAPTFVARAPSARLYRVVLGERAVEFEQDFDENVLRRLVQVVEGC